VVRLGRGTAGRLAALAAAEGAVVGVVAAREGGNALRAAVLAPLTVLLIYAVATRVLGPWLAFAAGGLWVTGPWIVQALLDLRVDPVFRETVVPAALGLSEWRGAVWAIALLGAGLLPRAGPAVFAGVLALALADAWEGGHALGRLWDQYEGLQEFFWTAPLALWLPVAGLVGLARRSLVAAGLFGAWAFAFLGVVGTSESVALADASVLAALVPAFPALAVLVAAIALIVPMWTGPAREDGPRAPS
jgi:hypothetical protein